MFLAEEQAEEPCDAAPMDLIRSSLIAMSRCQHVQTLMPMEGDPTEQEEDEQVGMAWTNWSEHMILKMAAAKVI